MRQFRADPIKNYQAMYPIEEKCKKGLKDQTEILFSNPDEPHAHQGLSVLRNLEVDLNSKGMEPVFHIRTGPNPGDVINMLKTPGVVTKQMIQQWIIDLTQLGVYRSDGTRHPVCPFDVQNLQLSAEAVLNSCTPQLHQDLEDQLLPGERDGPMILHRTIENCSRITYSRVEGLTNKLKALSILDYPGENILSFQHDASKLVRDIMMCFMQPDQVPQLTLHAIRGLQYSSCEFVRSSVFAMMVDCDVSGYAISKDPGKHALAALTSFVEMIQCANGTGELLSWQAPYYQVPCNVE